MELPYRVESLDDVPESARELYVEDGESFRLPVKDVKSKDEIAGLESALAKLKREVRTLKSNKPEVSDEDLEELEQLRAFKSELDEKKAKEEGKFDELRQKLTEKHAKDLDEVSKQLKTRDAVIERLTVTNELRSAIAEHGVDARYHKAVEALLRERGPRVDWNGEDMPRGVFPDEVEGDRPIGEYVKSWVETDEASAYMPPETGGGGGGTGSRGSGGQRPSWHGKKYSDMTMDEKRAFLASDQNPAARSGAAA